MKGNQPKNKSQIKKIVSSVFEERQKQKPLLYSQLQQVAANHEFQEMMKEEFKQTPKLIRP